MVVKLGLRVFENRMLRRIFGPKRDEVIGCWRKLYNGELRNLYGSPSIIRIIESRMRWAGHVVRMVEKRNAYRLLVESRKERGHYEDLDVRGRIILRWILER
jgi:hypothetical protein